MLHIKTVRQDTFKKASVSLIALFIAVIGIFASIQAFDTTDSDSLSLASSASKSGIVVQPLSPVNQSYASSAVTLSSTVSGLDSNQYEMFWAVGEGGWNRMSTSAEVSTANVDISNWNWNANDKYTFRFIALVKDGWYPIESAVTINKGTAPVVQPIAPVAQQPVEAAPTVTQSLPKIDTTPSVDAIKQPKLFVDPQSSTAEAARTFPNISNKFVAAQSTASWYGGWSNLPADINGYVTRAAAADSIPTVVLYNIPGRDCGSYSAGGAATTDAYLDWIKSAAAGIAGRPAFVILEPDALAGMDCLPAADQISRLDMINKAVAILKKGETSVYIDAGHATWLPATTAAKRLISAGIETADGFSLNVSNFRKTDESTAYGLKLSKLVDNKHFVIDTSRNGNGPSTSAAWCNPTGRALGHVPTLTTNNQLVDAYLWIKTPGESDGACGAGAPAAGVWWQSYLDGLYSRR